MTGRAAPVLLAAPSGTGKTTLARHLVEHDDRYCFSTSVTTRPPREGERDGIDYHFVDRAGFEARVARGELAEWAEVHGRLYGTPKAGLEAAANRGEHVVLDIDVQGAEQIRATLPEAKLIFVLPPNVDIMMSRLTGRGTEERSDIARRLQSALKELASVPDFDYVVVNDDLERCLADIREIVEHGRGTGPDRHMDAVEAYRAEIGRILSEDYSEYADSR